MQIRTWTTILTAIFLAAATPGQTTWYVDDDAPNDPGPGDPTVSDPLEDGSATDGSGGGLYCYIYSHPTLSNCTVSGNSAYAGGGVHCLHSSNPTLTNCTISGNSTYMGADESGSFQFGDLNCDGIINGFDIDAFIAALKGPAYYDPVYPDCDLVLADINADGAVNGFDIDPFITLLIGG